MLALTYFHFCFPAANPFGASSTPVMSQGGAMPGQVNPFGASSQPAGFGVPSTAGAGFGQAPASSAAGFGYQQFPVQNGGFGMVTTAGGYAPFGGAPPNTAPPSYGVAQQQGFQAQPGMAPQGFPMQQPAQQAFPVQQGFAAGWGQMGGAGGVPPQSTANPFMVGTTQSPHSNPFGQS